MCQQHIDSEGVESSSGGGSTPRPLFHGGSLNPVTEPFPWDVGVFDAHCHPTDTMSSVATIPHMKARGLTVMSTRLQDQDLVFDVAREQGVQNKASLFSPQATPERRFIPSFGWHPWFSYQIYDDTVPGATSYDGSPESKIAHYDKILAPAPSANDPAFSTGLPDPRPLSQFIRETRARLEKSPFALVGEVGLDKVFRIPESWTASSTDAEKTQRDESLTPGGREGRQLSPHRVSLDHQSSILKAHMKLAGEMNRAASVHGVQAHGALYNVLAECWKGHEKEVLSKREKRKIAANAENFETSDDEDEGNDKAKAKQQQKEKPFPPRICLHSYSGPVNMLKQYIHPSVPAAVFFSFSVAINWDPAVGADADKNKKTADAIRAAPDDRILVESDLHTAGDRMDQALEDVCRLVCDIKGWPLREGVERLARNWRHFVFGDKS
ncbi:Metallo-dependent hydrolase [Apiospora phragmitis]|uniref:Metallo-dependent hydrolase n=1 Tax=Apiospora phragmitis TaxID=2905665 RepID=A0ABR1T871_9PEZI